MPPVKTTVQQAIHSHGYPVIPIVKGRKNPAVSGWVGFDYAKDKWPDEECGVGILTGQARDGCAIIYAIDIDILDVEIAEEVRDTLLSKFGETPWRVGKAPKSLLVYRGAAPMAKRAGSAYAVGRVEILGTGQQFVAAGIHPDTQQPYIWPGLLGGPDEIDAMNLPLLDEGAVAEVLAAVDEIMTRHQQPVLMRTSAIDGNTEIDPLEAMTRKIHMPLEEARGLLINISPDDRTVWINVGQALHFEYDGSDEALAAWDEWSQGSPKYKEGEPEKAWRGFGRHIEGRRPITMRYVIKMSTVQKESAEREEIRNVVRRFEAELTNCSDYICLLRDIAPTVPMLTADQMTRQILTTKLKKRYKELTHDTLTKADLSRAMFPGRTITGRPLTEVGNAERLADRYGKDIIYVPEIDSWYRWDGTRWCPTVKEMILRLAAATIEGIRKEAEETADDDARSALIDWHLASQKASMLDNMVKLAQKEVGIMTRPNELDGDLNFIGVLNGAVHLPTGELHPPRKSMRLTLNTGHEYDPLAECPVFEQTVSEVFFGDQEMVRFLQRVIGYAMLGKPEKEEIVVIPEGKGANGKSTVFNAIHYALGSYARYSSADTFITAKGSSGASGGAREDVLRLMGARFVYVTELDEAGVLKESFVKGMCGGESLPARGLYARHTVEVIPTWVAFLPTNYLPVIRGEDKGIWRRIVVIPFHRDFTADPVVAKDVDRKTKLKAEAAGILRWCIEGTREYLRMGLCPPAAIQAATNTYKGEMDILTDWLDACCELGADYAISNGELWASWEMYAKRQGNLHLVSSSNSLARRLAGRGFDRIRNSHGVKGRGFVGLKIKDEEGLIC